MVSKVVKEFDYVMLKKDTNMKIFQILTNKPVNMCKEKFQLNGVLGHGYGSSFKVLRGQLVKIDIKELADNDKDDDTADCIKDNRNLIDHRENQRLSKEEINVLRKQGVTGEEIVEQLVENSSTFQDKTEFAQQKYIKKKKKKHVSVFTLLKPTTRNLVEMYYGRGPTKICNLRIDSLAQILTQVNVHSHSRLMVVESCSGLVVGSVLERMGCGDGSVVHLYTGSAPNRPALVDGYRFSEEVLKNLYSFPIDQIATLNRSCEIQNSTLDKTEKLEANSDLISRDDESNPASQTEVIISEEKKVESDSLQKEVDEGSKPSSDVIDGTNPTETITFEKKRKNLSDKIDDTKPSDRLYKKQKLEDVEERERRRRYRLEQIQKAKTVIEKADMDGLIVAAKLHPTPIVMSLIDFVLPSRPIVVFCPYREPLVDCFIKLRERGDVLMLKLTETWLREYQILPNRTHPSINMSGSGGYLLTATTITDESKSIG